MEDYLTRIFIFFKINYYLLKNRFTSIDHTNYFYKTKTSNLEESLDVFANMFSEPTFDEEVIKKEISVLENEY